MYDTTVISSEEILQCPVCGGAKKGPLHTSLEDQLFGAPGQWSYDECYSCGLVFLSPRPTRMDIGKAYADYSTHLTLPLPDTLLRRLRSYLRTGYLAGRYGYLEGIGTVQRVAGLLLYLHPGQREYVDGSIMHLPASRRGRVLDVGCGAGETLTELRRLGWQTEGVEPDPRAAEHAIRRGLDVKVGLLEDQRYPSGSFDAITMSHVIEHVHDPIVLLAECRRVLKPNGLLVVTTPNVKSLGHHLFGRHWRVLEVPRHLTVFSRETLTLALHEAGFSGVAVRTTTRGADGIVIEGQRMKAGGPAIGRQPASILEKLVGQSYQYVAVTAMKLNRDAGEELLATAGKL